MGVVDVILPFIIIFTIIFAALQKSHILGKDSKKYNVVIALVMGFSVVIPHVLWGVRGCTSTQPLANGFIDVVCVMNSALPNVSLIAIAFVMVMLILGIIGGDINFAGTSMGGWAVIVSVVAVILVFLSSANVFRNLPRWLYWTMDPYVKEIVVVILVFGIIIWFITSEPKDEGNKTFQIKDLTNIFGGGKK
jgi:hypothetical protein